MLWPGLQEGSPERVLGLVGPGLVLREEEDLKEHCNCWGLSGDKGEL